MSKSSFNGFVLPKSDKKGGSNIKSIQRGSKIMTSNSNTVTISSIDLTKAIPKITLIGKGGTSNPAACYVSAKITDETTLTLEMGGWDTTYAPTVEWEVVEFNNVKSLQKGSQAISAATTNVTITSINMLKSTLFYSYKTTSATLSNMSAAMGGGRINTATQLTFTQLNTDDKTIEWYVIEFY